MSLYTVTDKFGETDLMWNECAQMCYEQAKAVISFDSIDIVCCDSQARGGDPLLSSPASRCFGHRSTESSRLIITDIATDQNPQGALPCHNMQR